MKNLSAILKILIPEFSYLNNCCLLLLSSAWLAGKPLDIFLQGPAGADPLRSTARPIRGAGQNVGDEGNVMRWHRCENSEGASS